MQTHEHTIIQFEKFKFSDSYLLADNIPSTAVYQTSGVVNSSQSGIFKGTVKEK